MKRAELTLPELGLIAATRAALGGGIALLVADRLSAEQRKAVGWTLLAVGALTTIPLVAQVLSSTHSADEQPARGRSAVGKAGHLFASRLV